MKLAFFCSSKASLIPLFQDSIRSLIKAIELTSYFTAFVYGGGNSGLMGLVREYSTIPVIGHNMDRWDPLPGEFVYNSLRERQSALVDGADAYMILAGGVGTLHELFQVLCENDVEKRDKPVFVYDPDRVYSPLQDLLQRMYESGYISTPLAITFIRELSEVSTSLAQRFSK
jgi:hypothetical protein